MKNTSLIKNMKSKQKIVVLTAYDYTLATLCDRAGADVLLVGDSLGMIMLGYDSTIPVVMDEMCLFTSAVSRARKNAVIVADLPFMSYQSGLSDAIKNSGKLIQAGADAVKLEGGSVMKSIIQGITSVGIPVMGHIGLQPQTATLSDGYVVHGDTSNSAEKLICDAKSVEEAGAFSLVLEKVESDTARIITSEISIPTIGIGSGSSCDGQVLVTHDMLGMYDKINPKFVKKYSNLSGIITESVTQYIKEVQSGQFPGTENSFSGKRNE